jgi:hypothetical protein
MELVAGLLATAALWVRIQTSMKKHKMGDISKGVANTLKPAKKNHFKKIIQNNYIIQIKCYYLENVIIHTDM